jgi:hypothetical protein
MSVDKGISATIQRRMRFSPPACLVRHPDEHNGALLAQDQPVGVKRVGITTAEGFMQCPFTPISALSSAI